MLTFGSDEWIAALDDAARGDEQLATASAELALVVEQVLTDGTRWHVVVDHGAVRVRPGPADRPTVTFTQDRAVAAAIARGEDSAQAAFLRGDLLKVTLEELYTGCSKKLKLTKSVICTDCNG